MSHRIKFEGQYKQIHFDLKKPCEECPFKKGVPLHDGVLNSLPDYMSSIMDESFVHSCHRTDSRSDYELAKRYKGKLQHCAGAMGLMLKSDKVSLQMLMAETRGDLDLSKVDQGEEIYSLEELVKAYLEYNDVRIVHVLKRSD